MIGLKWWIPAAQTYHDVCICSTKKGERERITLSVGLNWLGNVEIFFFEMLRVIARGDEFVGEGGDVGTRATKVTCCVELY